MFQKYAAAVISILLTAFAFLKTAFADELDAAELWQLIALVAGAVITFLVPLVPGKWAGALKTGAAALAAVATAVVPFALQGTLTYEQLSIVALALLNALGVEVGVQARKSVIDAGTAAPGAPVDITEVAAVAADPEGAKALGYLPKHVAYDGETSGLFR
jgi:hypothetical protein